LRFGTEDSASLDNGKASVLLEAGTLVYGRKAAMSRRFSGSKPNGPIVVDMVSCIYL